MSQHDHVIANAAGAAFRADLNLLFLAMASQNSGATEPATMYAYQLWADTTTGILKQRNAANTAWISLFTMSTGAWAGNAATATTATVSNRVDSGIVTVASHATTGDIFGAAGNTINWTGTATTTAFTAASKAGMTRTLICAGACKFTAGANLLIEGVASGRTVTMAANAIVKVIAITTTQFKLTYSLSGTFSFTCTGFAATSPTGTARYSVKNAVVSLLIPQIIGTSNADSFTIAGLPACILPPSAEVSKIGAVFCDTGGSTSVLSEAAVDYGGSIYLYLEAVNGLWPTSGTKGTNTTNFVYQI